MEILEYTKTESKAHKFRIKIDAATMAKTYETVLADLMKETEVPGFRRGHAPRKMLERHVGVKEIWEQVRDKASDEALEEALKEKKLVAEEDAEFERDEYPREGDYVFSATVVAKSSRGKAKDQAT
jgi:trigger factor